MLLLVRHLLLLVRHLFLIQNANTFPKRTISHNSQAERRWARCPSSSDRPRRFVEDDRSLRRRCGRSDGGEGASPEGCSVQVSKFESNEKSLWSSVLPGAGRRIPRRFPDSAQCLSQTVNDLPRSASENLLGISIHHI